MTTKKFWLNLFGINQIFDQVYIQNTTLFLTGGGNYTMIVAPINLGGNPCNTLHEIN